MIPKLEIQLTSEKSLFLPGDKIEGVVCLEVPPDCAIRGLRVHCVGIGVVTWAAGFGDQATTHYEKEKFVNLTETLFEDEIQGEMTDESVISVGHHKLPFLFRLPANIPQTLEEPGCFTRYRLKACARRAGKSDVISKLTFQVGAAAQLDLNTLPDARSPNIASNSKKESHWCRKDSFVSARLRLERTGYVSGETIACTAEVDNDSHTRKVLMKFKLYKKITKRLSSGLSDATQAKLLEVHKVPERSGKGDYWGEAKITVPDVPPSTLPGCKCIELGYFVCLVVEPFDIRIPMDIVIGTEPFLPEESTNEIITTVDVHAPISEGHASINLIGQEEMEEDNVLS